FMLPTSTLRPSAVPKSDCSFGLNWFTSIRNGSARTTIRRRIITAATMIRGLFFMAILRRERVERGCAPCSLGGLIILRLLIARQSDVVPWWTGGDDFGKIRM